MAATQRDIGIDRQVLPAIGPANESPNLIVATNREPFALSRMANGELRLRRTTGGVVAALLPIVERGGGKWIAWHTGSAGNRRDIEKRLPYLSLVDVSADEVGTYYRGFANSALWPLFHYAIERCSFRAEDWESYVRVNRRFADRLVEEGTPGQLLWVHDYQLTLVPGMLREAAPTLGPIAYFHHVPFPSPDVVRVLPWYGQVLRGLLGADQIGFHTDAYVQNFLAACASLPDAGVDWQRRTVAFQGRDVRVGAFPIGVDVRGLEDRARLESVEREVAAIRQGLRVDKLLLSVDRLDYTKGIIERFEAIDQFFTIHPQLKGAVSLLQIAVPSRAEVSEYRQLKRAVDELVGRINGKHAQHGWQPIHCTYRSFSLNSLVAHYRAADAALVTPIRDGMNLVAKEFCASRIDEDGVLILSEFAGAAERLGAASLLVNPYDVTAYVHAIERALTMEPDERRQRMASLRASVGDSDLEGWIKDVVAHATSMP